MSAPKARPAQYVAGGIRDYDHTKLVELPEYIALRRALNDFMDRAGQTLPDTTMSDALQVATDLVYGTRYPNSCHNPTHPKGAPWVGGDVLPVAVKSSGENSLVCLYWCPECGTASRSNYTRSFAEWDL